MAEISEYLLLHCFLSIDLRAEGIHFLLQPAYLLVDLRIWRETRDRCVADIVNDERTKKVNQHSRGGVAVVAASTSGAPARHWAKWFVVIVGLELLRKSANWRQ
jgi:hypothetical protein